MKSILYLNPTANELLKYCSSHVASLIRLYLSIFTSRAARDLERVSDPWLFPRRSDCPHNTISSPRLLPPSPATLALQSPNLFPKRAKSETRPSQGDSVAWKTEETKKMRSRKS